MPDMDAFFDDSGHTAETEVKHRPTLAYAYIHNGKDEQGQGGLYIKRENLPEDVTPDPNYFKEVSVAHRDTDAPSGVRREQGFLADKYHLILLGFDHDENGYPRMWKNPDDNFKPVFFVYAIIWQAFSRIRPFRIKYQGWANALRMQTHVANFDRYIVGEATRIKIESAKQRGEENVLPACFNQFLLPVRHEPEMVGRGSATSWACPVQELVKDHTLKVAANGRRNGISTLKMYADDWEQLKKLYVPKLTNGVERVTLAADWVRIYGAQAKLVSSDKQTDAAHFSDDDELLADKTQIEKISELATGLQIDPDKEIQVLRGANTLKGGSESVTIFDLTKIGAATLISHLSEMVRQAPTSTVSSPADRPAEAKAAAPFDDLPV